MAAVWNVAWPISTEYAEDGRYNTLLQISIGQEEVDEVITRDIHRTFPEHPQFGFAQGQQALFRVLKAYSLHDLEACAFSISAAHETNMKQCSYASLACCHRNSSKGGGGGAFLELPLHFGAL